MSSKRICVIGAGPSGLTSIKQCLDEGFEVVCYEKSDSIGGLWGYREEDIDGLPSVTKNTIINTSKEMAAFSDFPPPQEYPNFMKNDLLLKYFQSYAEHYKLNQYIKLEHEVSNVRLNKSYEEPGEWRVTVRNLKVNSEKEHIFDGIMYCCGHHDNPDMPNFPGQSNFKGSVLHTHSYKKPTGMEDKIAVVVGTGNSAMDAAVELSNVCSQVYLSRRNGVWIGSRIGYKGIPGDMFYFKRFLDYLVRPLPFNLKCSIFENILNCQFDHEKYNLKPAHRLLSRHLTINDGLPNCLISGRVCVRNNIQRFTENGVVFEGETSETKCDIVVFGTGYKISFPCLDSALVPIENNYLRLYKSVFSPNLQQPHTFAFIGIIQVFGSVFPLAEMQARWFVQLMKGKVKLPKVNEMNKDIDEELADPKNTFAGSGRNTLLVEFGQYMDDIAGFIGTRPDLMKYFFTDIKLWYQILFGPEVPYAYRLEGPHSWPGARNAVMTVYDRCYKGLKR